MYLHNWKKESIQKRKYPTKLIKKRPKPHKKEKRLPISKNNWSQGKSPGKEQISPDPGKWLLEAVFFRGAVNVSAVLYIALNIKARFQRPARDEYLMGNTAPLIILFTSNIRSINHRPRGTRLPFTENQRFGGIGFTINFM